MYFIQYWIKKCSYSFLLCFQAFLLFFIGSGGGGGGWRGAQALFSPSLTDGSVHESVVFIKG